MLVLAARERVHLAIGHHHLQRLNRRGQIAIVDTRAVRCRGNRARHRDVRQGSKIVQRVALRVDHRRELSISNPRTNGHGVRLRVNVDRVELLQRDLILGAVRNGREGVPRAQSAQLGALRHHLLNLFHRCGNVQVIGAVVQVAGPVLTGRFRLLAREYMRKNAARHNRPRCLEKLPLVHCRPLLKRSRELHVDLNAR